jgi:hypothetical protein
VSVEVHALAAFPSGTHFTAMWVHAVVCPDTELTETKIPVPVRNAALVIPLGNRPLKHKITSKTLLE